MQPQVLIHGFVDRVRARGLERLATCAKVLACVSARRRATLAQHVNCLLALVPVLTPTHRRPFGLTGERGAPEAVWLAVHIALRRFDDLRAAFQAALQVCASSGGSMRCS